MKAVLINVGKQGLGRKYRLADECVIGRHPDCHVQLIDSQVSKRHARIVAGKAGFQLEDLDSLNGVYLNAKRISQPSKLAPNDIISIGSEAYIFNPALDVLPQAGGDRAVLLLEEDDTKPGFTTEIESVRQSGMSLLPSDFVIESINLLAGAKRIDEVLADIIRRLGNLVRFDSAALLQVGGRRISKSLYVYSRTRTVSISRTIANLAIGEKKGIRIPDAAGDTAFRGGKSVVRGKLRSVMVVPVWMKTEVVGVLFVAMNKPDFYSEQDLERLMQVGPLLALAMAQTDRVHGLLHQVAIHSEQRLLPEEIRGQSSAIKELNQNIAKIGPTRSSVLVTGETGTGKELVARWLHELGPGPDKPWVAVNCGALPENLVESELFGHEKGAFSGADRQKPGKLELASQGTLFLDEIGDLKLAMQVKLLRALEQKSFYRVGGVRPIEVDFRLVCATHRNLEEMCQAKDFRKDLYYRVNVLSIETPPLRDRLEDVETLVKYFLQRFSDEMGKDIQGIDKAALLKLKSYAWPGNIRELKNAIERIVVLGDQPIVTQNQLPVELQNPEPGPHWANQATMADRIELLERQMITNAMRKSHGKKVAAANLLGISRPTLDKKLMQFKIDVFKE